MCLAGCHGTKWHKSTILENEITEHKKLMATAGKIVICLIGNFLCAVIDHMKQEASVHT